MSLDIGTLVGYLDLDTSAFTRNLDDTEGDAKRSGGRSGKSFGERYAEEADKSLSDRLSGVAGKIMRAFGTEMGVTAKPTAMTVATAFSAQFIASVASGLASGAAKIAHGLAAAAALLPAAAVAGVIAFGTLKLAVLGVGDALSAGLAGDTDKFNEALQSLSPSAQEVTRTVVGLKDQIGSLKSLVQENFFSQFASQVEGVARTGLRQLHLVLGDVAIGFGQAVSETAGFLETPAGFRGVWTTLDNGRLAVNNLTAGLGNLLPALLPLFTVGSTFLPGLTDGFDGLTARFAAFMQEAERSGRLREFIQGGIDSVRELMETGRQVGRILENIGDIVGQAFDGIGLKSGGLLDSLERITEQAVAFFDSASGSEVMAQVFDTVGAILNTLLGTLQRVGGMLGRVFGPILPKILEFVEAMANLKSAVLDVGLDALEPILGAIGTVLGNVVLPALTGLANFLADNQTVLQSIGIAIVALLVPAFVSWAISAGLAAVATFAAMLPILLIGAAIAALAYLVITHFDTIKSVISGVWNWIKDNWQTLLIILTGPIGAAVALIVTHWDTIWAAGKAVWQWLVDNWQILLGILTAPITLAVSIITGAWDSVVSFVTGLPERIRTAASGMWNGIVDAFKTAINTVIGWWNGISFKLPTITIPGFDPPGPGPSFGGATIGGQTFSTPDIPTLHGGGTVNAGGPGREALRILQHGEEVLRSADPRHRDNLGATQRAGGALAGRIVIDVTGSDREMVEMVRKRVAADFGGDVQVALGQS